MAKKVVKTRKSPRLRTEKRRREVRKSRRFSPDTTMDIIDKLSKQFKKVDDDISFKQVDHQSRKNPVGTPRSIRSLSPSLDITSPSTDNLSTSLDHYDFDQTDDDICLRLDLSPIRDVQSPIKSKKQRKTPGSNSKVNSAETQKTEVRKSQNSNAKSGSTQCHDRKQITPTSVVKITSSRNSSNKKVKKLSKTKKLLIENGKKGARAAMLKQQQSKENNIRKSKVDSAGIGEVFLAPSSNQFEVDEDRDVDFSGKAPTSTPAVTPAAAQPSLTKSRNRQCKRKSDYNYNLTDSPMLSPVKKVNSPHSQDLGVLVTSELFEYEEIEYPPEKIRKLENIEPEEPFKTLSINKTYSDLSLRFFQSPIEKKKQKKSAKKKDRQSLGRFEVIADQMNLEFQDAEEFQLSID